MAKKKRHFDEFAEDIRLTNAEQRFRITVFNCMIDTVTLQLIKRFTAMNNVAAKFSVIFPSVLSSDPYQNMTSYYRPQLYRKNTAFA